MAIRQISKELQQIAITELNENPNKMQENLQHLREWLQKQPHLNSRTDDQFLITFIRLCKGSLQRTKEKIDYFYTYRTLTPDFFKNRYPFDSLTQRMLEKGIAFPLPNTDGPAGARIIYSDSSAVDYETMDPTSLINFTFMLLEILMFSDDNFSICGCKYIINCSSMPLNFILKLTPALVYRFILGLLTAYPLRHKLLIGINTPRAVEKFFSTIAFAFLSKKHQNRIYLFTSENNEKAYSLIPKTLFPEELGGNNGSILKLAGEFKTTVKSYGERLLESHKYGTKESLRPGKPKTYNEEFGFEGTFNRLEID